MEFGEAVYSGWRRDATIQHHKTEDSVGHPEFRDQDAETGPEPHLSGSAGPRSAGNGHLNPAPFLYPLETLESLKKPEKTASSGLLPRRIPGHSLREGLSRSNRESGARRRPMAVMERDAAPVERLREQCCGASYVGMSGKKAKRF